MHEQNTPIIDGMNPLQRILKWIFDVVMAVCAMILLSPLLLICIVIIKIEDWGPIIYSQERIGKAGKPFKIYKFRTTKRSYQEQEPTLMLEGEDSNLTKVGKYLRDHHLDELPQFWNVLIGDMSLVGPRPERAFFIEQIMQQNPRYEDLYQIQPGITSYATLHNGYTYTMQQMLKRLDYDLYYLEHRSCKIDLKILWQTFCYILGGRRI